MSVTSFALRLAGAVALVGLVSSVAVAAIYPPERQLSAQIISDFKGAPADLLTQYPSGGPQMISRVRDLGASDPSTVPGLIGLLKDPGIKTDQVRAIVAGLAQLARMAAQQDQAFADEIQRSVASTNNPDVIAAYQAAAGDVAIAAAGGGAGGGGSGAGGPTGSGGFAFGGFNNSPTFGALHYSNSPSSYTGSVVGATSSGSVTSTTINQVVSPTR